MFDSLCYVGSKVFEYNIYTSYIYVYMYIYIHISVATKQNILIKIHKSQGYKE